MRTRLTLGALLLVGGFAVAPQPQAWSQESTQKIPFDWASGIPGADPQFTSASVASELGFFKLQGIELSIRITAVSGGAGAVPLVSAGRAQVGYTGSEAMLFSAANGQDTGTVIFFAQNRENIFRIGVLPDSPIKSVRDLKGTTVGARVAPSAMSYYLTGLMRSQGFQPDKDFEIVGVGSGAGAISELTKRNISALVMSDTVFASVENNGVKFRYLDPGPYAKEYSSGGIFARRDYVASHQKELCAFGRGVAMGVEFTLANPEAAVKLHWKHYPESKPLGGDEATALKQSRHILDSHVGVWDVTKQSDPRHGASRQSEWMSVVAALGLGQKVSDAAVSKIYTNDLVPCFNDFDVAQVRAMARDYKM